MLHVGTMLVQGHIYIYTLIFDYNVIVYGKMSNLLMRYMRTADIFANLNDLEKLSVVEGVHIVPKALTM